MILPFLLFSASLSSAYSTRHTIFPLPTFTAVTRFSFPMRQWCSNPGSYQSTTADTSGFLSETLFCLASVRQHYPELSFDLCDGSLPRLLFRQVQYCVCPKTREKLWHSPFTLCLSHNSMIHGFNHQVHVIILKSKSWAFTSCLSPSHLVSTAQGTPPRYNIAWKSTYRYI